MATYKKYQKKPTVVGALQITAASAGNYGDLGTLASGDWMLYLSDGTVHSMMDAQFQLNYDQAGDTALLTGSDWS